MIAKLKRFLGNLKTLEVHDTYNEKASCRLDEIKSDHRRWYGHARRGETRPALRQLPLVPRRKH